MPNGARAFRYLPRLAGIHDRFQVLLWAILINLILFGLFLSYATPAYETNDDMMMQMIASGFHTGHPDEHLVFTNVMIGWALRFLYEVWTGHNWYFFYLMAVHYAALTAIAFLVLSRRMRWWFTFLYVGFFLAVELRILLHLQFTTTAFLAGTAGLLLLVDGLKPGQPGHWSKVIAGFTFIGIMCLIREPVAPLLVIMACPFLLERLGLTEWRRLLGVFFAIAGIFLTLHEINRWDYQRDPAWAEFSEYNRLRGEIHITPLAKLIPQAAPAVGWSENDGWMFSQFSFSDPDVYAGISKMRLFLDKLKMLASEKPASAKKHSENFAFLPGIFLRDSDTLTKLAMLSAVGCVFLAGASWRRCLATLLISFGIQMLLNHYLQTTARLPERVAYNLPLFIIAICLYWAAGFRSSLAKILRLGHSDTPTPLKRPSVLRVLFLVIFPIWTALFLYNLSVMAKNLWAANASTRNLEHISHQIFAPIRKLLPDHQTPILVAMPYDSIFEKCLFFYPSNEKPPFSMVPYGWITHSPIFKQVLERHRLVPYSTSLVDRPDVFFLMGSRWVKPLTIFYREHYDMAVRFDLIVNTDEIPECKDWMLQIYQARASGHKAQPGAAP